MRMYRHGLGLTLALTIGLVSALPVMSQQHSQHGQHGSPAAPNRQVQVS